MKKFFVTSVILGLGLCLVGCLSRSDDYFYQHITLRINDALTFDNQQNYVLGDTLFYEIKFSRYLEEEGYESLLDVYKTTASEKFWHLIDLEQFSLQENAFRRLRIADEFLLYERDSRGTPVLRLNEAQTDYEARVGIILKETGQYRLDFDYLYFRSINYDYTSDYFSVTIEHSFSADPPNTEFVVSE